MRKHLTLGLALLMAGCTTFDVDPRLPSNVTVSGPQNGQPLYVSNIHFAYDGIAANVSLPKCVAAEVVNRQYSISDSSDSYFSPWSGYHDHTRYREIGGGQTLVYSDPNAVVANGTVLLTSGSGLSQRESIVAFKLKAERQGDNVQLDYTNISQAMTRSSSVANPGLRPLGAWSSAHPLRVYDALEQLSNKLAQCLKGS